MEILKRYFPALSEDQIRIYGDFKEVFLDWNDKINCVSRKDVENFEERHILHSLAIAKVIEFPSKANVLDVGTGGGFPGLPLAIMFPKTQFHLIDGIGKKIKVVNGVVESLGLKNVKAQKVRSEELEGSYDFITARAVARANTFHHWIKHLRNTKSFFKDAGIYYLKGGDLKEEMQELKRPYKIWDLETLFDEPFFETKKVVKF